MHVLCKSTKDCWSWCFRNDKVILLVHGGIDACDRQSKLFSSFFFASVAAKMNYIFRRRPFWNLNDLWTPTTDFSGFPVLMKPGLCFRPNDTHRYIWWILRAFHVFLPSLAAKSWRARYSIYIYIHAYICRADHWWKHSMKHFATKNTLSTTRCPSLNLSGTSLQA